MTVNWASSDVSSLSSSSTLAPSFVSQIQTSGFDVLNTRYFVIPFTYHFQSFLLHMKRKEKELFPSKQGGFFFFPIESIFALQVLWTYVWECPSCPVRFFQFHMALTLSAVQACAMCVSNSSNVSLDI